MTGTHVVAVVYAVSAAVALVTMAVAWRHRGRTPAALYEVVIMLALAAWALSDFTFMVAPQPWLQSAVVLVVSPCAAVAVAAFFLLTLTMTSYSRRPSTRTTVLLAVEPVLVVLASLTNHWHHGFGAPVVRGDWPWVLPWHPGALFWLHTVYSYTLLGYGVSLVLKARRHAEPPYRGQLTALVVATLLPDATNVTSLVCYALGVGVTDLSSVPFVLSGVVSTWAILQLSMFRLAPIAREAVLETIGDAIVVIDRDDRVVDANATARRLFLRTDQGHGASVIGRDVLGVFPALVTHGPGEHTIDGTVLDVHVTDIADSRGRQTGRVLVARDVTQLHEQRQDLLEQLRTIEALRAELAEQTTRDPLTGLHNRRRLSEALARDAANAVPGKPLSVLMVDVDHFKRINDTYGHVGGDDFLVAAAGVLDLGTREGETVARYGGEEFVVVLPGTVTAGALARAEGWRARFESLTVPTAAGPVRATISVGVATSSGGRTAEELLQAADQALYAAKAGGRNQVRPEPQPLDGADIGGAGLGASR